MFKILTWFSKMIKPVPIVGKPVKRSPIIKPIGPELALIASLQSVLQNTDPDLMTTDPVMKRRLILVYHQSLDDLVLSVYDRNKYDGDHRPYAVSVGVYFKNRLPIRDLLGRLITALENNPRSNLRSIHDVEAIVHVLTISSVS